MFSRTTSTYKYVCCINPLVNYYSHGKVSFIVELYPLNMVIPHSYVKLPEGVYIYIHSNTCSLHSVEGPADWMSCFFCLVVLGIHDCPSLPFDCQVPLTQILGLSPPGNLSTSAPTVVEVIPYKNHPWCCFCCIFPKRTG